MKDKELEELYKECDAVVVCSTQNQMVNYIPIINMWDAKQSEKGEKQKFSMYTITYESTHNEESEEARFDNSGWDKNLQEALEKDIEECSGLELDECLKKIIINRNIKKDAFCIKEGIKAHKNIIWNITGGQRNAVLSILKVVSELDKVKGKENENVYKNTLIYLEGNTGKVMVRKPDCGIWEFDEVEGIYGAKEGKLTVEKAFALAGFKDLSTSSDQTDLNKEAINKFFEYYKKDVNLRKKLVETLRGTSTVRDVLDDNSNIHDDVKEAVSKGHKGNSQFGYILECMAFYQINKALEEMKKNSLYENFFLDLVHNVNLSQKERFCQFDIVLLLKTGQIVIFECKAGLIESKDAKERNYTVYATSGVYGTPVLITPMLKEDITEYKNNQKPNTASKKKQSTDGQKEETWERTYKTYRAAQRANMRVWAMDDIVEKIQELFKDVIG